MRLTAVPSDVSQMQAWSNGIRTEHHGALATVRATVLPTGETRVWTVAPDGTQSSGPLHTVQIDTEALRGLLAAFTRSCGDRRCPSTAAARHGRRDLVEALTVNKGTAFLRVVPSDLDPPGGTQVAIGHLEIDAWSRQLRAHGEPVELTAMEFDLLLFLATRPGQVFSRDELLREVWKSSPDWQQTATVTEHVRRLRAKTEVDPRHPTLLRTVRGAGYRFDLPAPSAHLAPEVGDLDLHHPDATRVADGLSVV